MVHGTEFFSQQVSLELPAKQLEPHRGSLQDSAGWIGGPIKPSLLTPRWTPGFLCVCVREPSEEM